MSSKKISTTQHTKSAPASRARVQFASLASKLQSESAALEAWQQARREAVELAETELRSAKQQHDERLKQLVVLLDRKHGEAGLDELEQAQLSDFLAETALDLLDQEDDDELEVIYQRHSDDSEYEDAIYPEQFRELVNEIVDLELDEDIDLRTPEGRETVLSLLEQDAEDDDTRNDRARAAQARAEKEKEQLAARLGAAFDALLRELEESLGGVDPDQDRQRARIELMQRIEGVRDGRRLEELLPIRFELEQFGLAAHFSEKQLSECNKLLKEALCLCKLECTKFVHELSEAMPGIAVERATPDFMLHALRSDISDLRMMAGQLEQELVELQDTKKLAAWLERLDEMDDL